MHRISYLLIVGLALLYAINGNAQTTDIKVSASKNKKQHLVFQKAAKMNVFYVGVDNPLTIETSNILLSELSLRFKSENITGEIHKSSDNYVVSVKAPGFCSIDIYYKDSLINSEQYTCKYIPEPTPTIGGKYIGGSIESSKMIEGRGVVTVLKGFQFDCKITIDSFSMTHISMGKLQHYTTSGPMYNSDMKNILSTSKENDVVIIDNICITPSDGNKHILTPMSFILK